MYPQSLARVFGVTVAVIALTVLAAGASIGAAQHGQAGCCMGQAGQADHQADMQLFHQLFDHRQEITRQVVLRNDGVETVTESENADVRALLQKHVASMLMRVEQARPIHQRDPLFREIFRHADKIEARYELTPKGVRVVETSSDPYVVKLIQAHADVVSAFIANGHSEMMKNHPVPQAN